MKELTGCLMLVGTAADCPDLLYTTGFKAVDPVVLALTAKQWCLVVPEMEFGRAKRAVERHGAKTGHTREVVTPELLGLDVTKRRRVGNWAAAVARRVGAKHVTVSSTFPLSVARRLERGKLRVVLSKERLFPQRDVKSGPEIANIRQCQQAAVIAMRGAITFLASAKIDEAGILRVNRNRLLCEDVQRLIGETLMQHDCFCGDLIVSCGRQTADPHEIGHGPLHAGQVILIDIFPQHLKHGYWGDLTRTVVKGEAPKRLKRMFYAVRAAQGAALDRLHPGVKGSSVHRAASGELLRRGFVTARRDGRMEGFTHSTGHGVGLSIHEWPVLGPMGERLKRGHVVTVEPGLYYADIGGIRIEDTVVVTPGGWQYLVPCERRFEI